MRRLVVSLALIHSYYSKYETAKGDAEDYCLVGTDAAKCKQLPQAIDDLKRMVAAAASGDHYGMTGATGNYVSDMVPAVTDALHDVDPVWPEEH